jgi:hypothetical protein
MEPLNNPTDSARNLMKLGGNSMKTGGIIMKFGSNFVTSESALMPARRAATKAGAN